MPMPDMEILKLLPQDPFTRWIFLIGTGIAVPLAVFFGVPYYVWAWRLTRDFWGIG